jgi:hypothetical protein
MKRGEEVHRRRGGVVRDENLAEDAESEGEESKHGA